MPSSLSLRVSVLRPQPSNFAASWRPPRVAFERFAHQRPLELRHCILEQRRSTREQAGLRPTRERLRPVGRRAAIHARAATEVGRDVTAR